jgi:hypothetical protein
VKNSRIVSTSSIVAKNVNRTTNTSDTRINTENLLNVRRKKP